MWHPQPIRDLQMLETFDHLPSFEAQIDIWLTKHRTVLSPVKPAQLFTSVLVFYIIILLSCSEIQTAEWCYLKYQYQYGNIDSTVYYVVTFDVRHYWDCLHEKWWLHCTDSLIYTFHRDIGLCHQQEAHDIEKRIILIDCAVQLDLFCKV